MKYIIKRKWLFWWTLEQVEFVVETVKEANKVGTKGGSWQSFKLKDGMTFDIKDISIITPGPKTIEKAGKQMITSMGKLKTGYG